MHIITAYHRHGLSYTSFEFTDLAISEPSSDDVGFEIRISLSVRNVGPVIGSEVAQLYVSYPPTGHIIPQRQLRGFAKVHDLPPGGSKEAVIVLDRYAFSFWDAGKGVWVVGSGSYGISVGNSSDSLPLEGELVMKRGLQWTGL